jgi:hypothetical protein
MRTTTDIPRHLQERVRRELEWDERIEWMDTPVPRFFTPLSTGAFLFAILWTAFAIFWIYGASGFKMPDFGEGGISFFPLFGVPHVLIGLALLFTPLWAYRKALRTVYVITDRRAITFDGGWSGTIRSYPPDKLQDIHRREKRDGSGDVIIARRALTGSGGDHRSEDQGFLQVRNPKEVEHMLKKLAEQSDRPPLR